MAKQGDEVRKEFVMRRAARSASESRRGVGKGPITQTDLDVLAVASIEFLTKDEARRIAANFARLPELLRKG